MDGVRVLAAVNYMTFIAYVEGILNIIMIGGRELVHKI